MTRSRGILTPRRRWTADDDETLRINYPHFPVFLIAHVLDCTMSQVYNRAFALKLKKSPDFWRHPLAHLWHGGRSERARATQFKKGLVPHNKGLRRPGWAPGRMATTQFKKGQLSGAAARNLVPVGTEVVDPDGYRKVKVRDDAPPNMGRLNWKFSHVLLWEEHLGPVPPGHAVIFRNGDRADIRIDNLALVSRAALMKRNSYHTRYPKEIALAIQMRGALTRVINRRKRHELHSQ